MCRRRGGGEWMGDRPKGHVPISASDWFPGVFPRIRVHSGRPSFSLIEAIHCGNDAFGDERQCRFSGLINYFID